jgi:hypothetical protein
MTACAVADSPAEHILNTAQAIFRLSQIVRFKFFFYPHVHINFLEPSGYFAYDQV